MTLMDTAQLLGNFGEFVGAIAVVVTLLFLSFQVRQGARAQRSATLQSWVGQSAVNNEMLATSDILQVAMKARGGLKELDETERARFTFFMNQNFNGWEAFFFHNKNGTIDDTFFESKRIFFVEQFEHRGIREYWDFIAPRLYDPRFREYVTRVRQEADRTTTD